MSASIVDVKETSFFSAKASQKKLAVTEHLIVRRHVPDSERQEIPLLRELFQTIEDKRQKSALCFVPDCQLSLPF